MKTKEELLENPVTAKVAGRIMTKRVKGKVGFMHIQDREGQIQIYLRFDVLGEESYAIFKTSDIGDIVGITGEVFRTKMGEISIHATEVTLLSKSLQILPEKYHGLTDVEMRYRQRYVDLVVNDDVKEIFIKRNKIYRNDNRYINICTKCIRNTNICNNK